MLHLAVLGIVAAELHLSLLPPLDAGDSAGERVIALEGAFASANVAPPPLESLPLVIDARREAAARDAQAMDDWATTIVDPRVMELFADEKQLSDGERSLAADFVQTQVLAAIAEAERHTTDEQFERLRTLTEELNRTGSEESVAELATKFQKWLGTDKRAAAPVAGASGEFDLGTAQLHDVRRDANPDGSYAYTSVLVDAAGRQMETSMTVAEGENLFRIMELIKANPLLERVYRSVVMSLLDKLTRPME